MNHKRLYRVYREAGLSIRRKKRKHCVRVGQPLRVWTAANQEWALDFVHDTMQWAAGESGQAVLEETLSPLAHGGISPVQTTSDLGVSLSLRRPEYEFGPCHQSVRQNAGSGQAVKLGLFIWGKYKGRHGASSDHVRSLSQSQHLC